MEPIFTKLIPCSGVGILKMILCSAARPRTETYMSTPPPRGLKETFGINRKLPTWKVEAFIGLSTSNRRGRSKTERVIRSCTRRQRPVDKLRNQTHRLSWSRSK